MLMKSLFKGMMLVVAVLFVTHAEAADKTYRMSSPDGKIVVKVTAGDQLTYSVEREGKVLVAPSQIAMKLNNGETIWGENAKLRFKSSHIRETIPSPSHRSKEVTVDCWQMDLSCRDYGVQFRVFDNGVAWRFYSRLKDEDVVTVDDEVAEINFDADYKAWVPYCRNTKEPFKDSWESIYTYTPISQFNPENLAFLPVLVDLGERGKVLVTESDLESYPGMPVAANAEQGGFAGRFPKYPKESIFLPTRCQEKIVATEDYIARFSGERTFPWRVIAFAKEDRELPTNDLVYALGAPCRIADPSWIVPGHSAWDWWNDWSISHVDFKVGINTETYKYFVDFAAEYDLEYIILDEGWSPPKEGDVMKSIPEIDVKEIVDYAKSKDVKVILWVVANVLDDKLEEAMKYYGDLGVAGWKVDFIDRTDQKAVEMIYRISDAAARNKMVIDFHGMYKPTGLNRTYPNVLNFEGVFGLEQLKWSNPDMPLYDVTMPFIRMVPGPADYTQGAMRNANKTNFRSIYSTPMSQGTRCHQIGTYVVFDSPLVMLCDTPVNYKNEPEVTQFIARIPTNPDRTVVLQGKVGEYIVTAREKEGTWYVGGLTNWTGRTIELPLTFLGDGMYEAEILTDGVNANRVGEDYRREVRTVNQSTTLTVDMANGGGFAMILTKSK